MSVRVAATNGRVHRIGDDVDTDAMLPGRYLALREPAALGAHCFEDYDPDFRQKVRPGDILVAGRNLGCGSSREHAVIALKSTGISAIVAHSAARIFYRNAINLGLPVMLSPEAAAGLEAGKAASVDPATGEIRQDGRVWTAQPLGDEVEAILAAGGLIERVRRTLTGRATSSPETGKERDG
ncbi:MAG: 3-isopropylmalate dehydratase small subunit [Pseudolabrys sp.]